MLNDHGIRVVFVAVTAVNLLLAAALRFGVSLPLSASLLTVWILAIVAAALLVTAPGAALLASSRRLTLSISTTCVFPLAICFLFGVIR